MIASEVIGIFILLIVFFTTWLLGNLVRAVFAVVGCIAFFLFLPIPIMTFLSVTITLLLISLLTGVIYGVVLHDQRNLDRNIHQDD